MTAMVCALPNTLMEASTGGPATSDLDEGKNGGHLDHNIGVDETGDDETAAKYNSFNTWDDEE